jgi:hypothetical protein
VNSGASGKVSSSCSTSDTRGVTLVTNPVISHEWGNDHHRRLSATDHTNKLSNNTTGVASVAWLQPFVVLSGVPVAEALVFCVVLCRSLFVLFSFENNLQNTTQKNNDRATRTPLKPEENSGASGKVSSSCSTSDTRRVTLVTNPVISHEWGNDHYSYLSVVAYNTLQGHLSEWQLTLYNST